MLKKICHMSSVHSMNDIRIFIKECQSMSVQGYEVNIVAQHDKCEIINGIKIECVHKPANRLIRMTKTIKQVYKKALKVNADLYHFHDPELILVALKLKRMGKKVIYDVHEDVPRQILTKKWIWQPFRRSIALLVRQVEKVAGKKFNKIIAATPSIAKNFPEDKTEIVQNYPLKDELLQLNPKYSYKERNNNVAYIGGISEIRGIREMISAINLVDEQHDVKLLLGGSFMPSKLESEMKNDPGWRKVNYLGWLSRERLSNCLSNTKIGLILFHPAPNHIEAQPNKLFEYMSAGLPVVASNFPLWQEIIEENNCGVCVDPLSADEIAETINWLIENPERAKKMGENGRRVVEEKYNWENEAKKLIKVYEELLT